MASIIPGYEYDIFISYRQKDNKGEKWVSEFVEALKTELESTLKDEISVYFDIHPHDGLLETHDVDASLKEKLKCLIFIPVISRTYCDAKSFAWEHEFKAFLQIAGNDQFGLKVKLSGGNIASRVLPVQIHELDQEDKQMIDKELGGFLRGIEFIYKEPGVNRPLREHEEAPQNNLNHTTYRNQINKVANSIRELIAGLKNFETSFKESIQKVKTPAKEEEKIKTPGLGNKKYRQKLILSAIVIILAAIGLIFGGRFISKNKISRDVNGKISLTVVNFHNNTNDTTLNWLESGIPELLRNKLPTNNNELSIQNSQVIQEVSESIRKKGNSADYLSAEIARKLNSSVYLTGSFQKYGDDLLTLAKLIDTKTDEVLWAGQTLGNLKKINTLTDSLSILLKNFLEIKALNRKTGADIVEVLTSSVESYRAYINGIQLLSRQDNENALKQFLYAVEKDSNFVMASFFVANAYDAQAAFSNDPVKEMKYRKMASLWIKKTYGNRDKLPELYRLWVEMWYAYYITKNSQDVIRLSITLGNMNIQSRYMLRDIAETLVIFERYKDALPIYEKIEKINESWGEQWKNYNYYHHYIRCCYLLGLYEKGNKIQQIALKIFPQDPGLGLMESLYGGFIKDSTIVNNTIARLAEQGNWTSEIVAARKADVYRDSGWPELSEKYFRMARKLSGNNDFRTFWLAAFLIDKNSNIDEGMRDLMALLKKYPWNNDAGYFTALGFLKQGKVQSADSVFRILEDSTLTASLRVDKLRKALQDARYSQK